ncbi:MAG: hypothetical protein K9L64_04330 [Candidatus Izimaplasma sp.]|nr:hypothetical protein [Candidatus Izimaplasma bacterium]
MILSEQKLIKNLYLQIKSNGILLEGQNGNLNDINKIVDEIYNKVFIKGKTSKDYDIQDEFYAFLTGGAQSFGFVNYRIERKITPDEHKKYQTAYAEVAKTIQIDKNKWKSDADGTWWAFFKKGVDNKESNNYKRYLSLKKPKLKQLSEHFGILLNNLYDIPSVFSCKMPADSIQFINAVDDIVIYFQDPKDKDKIEDAIKSSGIETVDRKSLYRSDYGQDKTMDATTGKKSSDTEILSRQYAKAFQAIMNQKDSNGMTNFGKLKGHKEIDTKKYLKDILLKIFNSEAEHRDVKL